MGTCKSVQCGGPKPIFKTIINEIFKPTLTENPGNKTNIDADVNKLNSHVKANIKGLIDHLESNNNKLIDVGYYLSKHVTHSNNPETYLVGLFVLNELITESKKFRYDASLASKMRMARVDSNIDEPDDAERNDDAMTPDYNRHLTQNIMQFEDSSLDILVFLLDKSYNPYRKAIFKYLIVTFQLYGKYKCTTYYSDKLENVFNGVLELASEFKDYHNAEDLAIMINAITSLIYFAKLPSLNILYKFKQKYVDFSYKTLISLYEDGNKSAEEDITAKRQELQKTAYDLMNLVLLNTILDLNEFGYIITPIFLHFDSIKWENEPFQNDVFKAFLTSSGGSLEKIEIFLIEKLLEYLDLKRDAQQLSGIRIYKNNAEKTVKIKVFEILKTVLGTMSNTYLSFMFIDHLVKCFLNNVDLVETRDNDSIALKEKILSCHEKFLSKINPSSKQLIQVLNRISIVTVEKCAKHRDEYNLKGHIEFLLFTLDNIKVLPTYCEFPSDALYSLIKIRDLNFHTDLVYLAVERILLLKFVNENEISHITEIKPDDKPTEPLHLSKQIVFLLTKQGIKVFRDYLNQEATSDAKRLYGFYRFLKHQAKITRIMLARKDIKMLNLMIPYFVKILEFVCQGKFSSSFRFGFCALLIDNLMKLDELWSVEGLQLQLAKLHDIYYSNKVSTKLLPLQKLLSQQELLGNFIKSVDEMHYEPLEKFEKSIASIQLMQVNDEALKTIDTQAFLNTLLNHFIKINSECFQRFTDNFEEIKDVEILSQGHTHSASGDPEFETGDDGKFDYSMDPCNSFTHGDNNGTPALSASKNGIRKRMDDHHPTLMNMHQLATLRSHGTESQFASAQLNTNNMNTPMLNQKEVFRPELDESYEKAMKEIKDKEKKDRRMKNILLDNKI
jgi:hypothetical protein